MLIRAMHTAADGARTAVRVDLNQLPPHLRKRYWAAVGRAYRGFGRAFVAKKYGPEAASRWASNHPRNPKTGRRP